MATKEKKGASTEKEIGELVSRSERFIEKYQQHIIYCIAAIAIIIGSIFGIRQLYFIPLENKAEQAIWKGQLYFERDSFALALHGNNADYPGFISIIDNYSMTTTANLARAYAGICYFRMGEPDKATEMLKKFKTREKMISPVIVGLIGDCYTNAGNSKDGISYYEKAAKMADNELISPLFLKKAGYAYEEMQQYSNAVKVYTLIKDKYFNSEVASDIDKYIARASSQLSSK